MATEQPDGPQFYPGEPDEFWSDSAIEERAKRTIIETLVKSAEHYRSLRSNWDDFYDRYTNQPLKLRQTNRVRSSVPSGMVPEFIDSARADLASKIHKRRPIISAVPQEQSDMAHAQARENLLSFQLDNATETMGLWPVTDMVLFQGLTFGSCPVKMTWVERVIDVMIPGMDEPMPQITYRGPMPVPIYIYDHFPHPGKEFPNDPYPQCHVSYESFDNIERLADKVYIASKVQEIPETKDGMRASIGREGESVFAAFGDAYERSDQRARLGWTADNQLQPDGVCVIECECMFRHRKDEMPVRSILTMANGVVIRYSRTPLTSQHSVWINAKTNHLPGQWYGMSMVQKNKPQVHTAELALNMALQGMAQTVNRPKVVRRDLLESARSYDDQPGNVFIAKPGSDINQVMREIPGTSVIGDAMTIISYSTGRAEGTVGQDELRKGHLPKGEQTATESNIAFSQSSVRLRHGLEWIGASWFLPMARIMDSFNQDFLDLPFVHRVLGKNAPAYQKVEPPVLGVPVDYIFMGPTRDENEALSIAQLQNNVKVGMPLVQLIPGMDAVMKEFFVQLLDRTETKNIEEIKRLIGYGETGPLLEQGSPTSPDGTGRRDSRVGLPKSNTSTGKTIAASLGQALTGQAPNVRG